MKLYGESSETSFTDENTRCQFHIVTRVSSSRQNHSNCGTTCQIQRFKTHKWFQWTFFNSPKQSPCTGKGAGINTFPLAILLARRDVNRRLLSSSLVGSAQASSPHYHHHNNKTLGGWSATSDSYKTCNLVYTEGFEHRDPTVTQQGWSLSHNEARSGNLRKWNVHNTIFTFEIVMLPLSAGV